MSVEDIVRWILGTPRQSWGSVFRVLTWTVLFVILAGQFTPKRAPQADDFLPTRPGVFEMFLKNGQLREEPPEFEGGEQVLNMAWIAGSTTFNLLAFYDRDDKYFLPIRTADLLMENHDRKINLYSYNQTSQRFLDTYTVLLEALSRNPDIIIVTLNPAWLYNSHSIFSRQNVFNARSDLLFTSASWLLWISVTTPSSHFFTHLGKHVPVVIPPKDYQKAISRRPQQFFGSAKQPTKAHVGESTVCSLETPLCFWLNQASSHKSQPESHGEAEAGSTLEELRILVNVLERANTVPESFAATTLQAIDKLVAESGVPVFFYLAPVSPRITEFPAAADGLERVAIAVDNLEQNKSGSNMVFLARIPQARVDSIAFGDDLIHVEEFGGLDRYLAEEINKFLRTQQ